MLVRMQNVGMVPVEEVCHSSNNSLLVGAVNQKNGSFFHGQARLSPLDFHSLVV
jgi:hypothetical protein